MRYDSNQLSYFMIKNTKIDSIPAPQDKEPARFCDWFWEGGGEISYFLGRKFIKFCKITKPEAKSAMFKLGENGVPMF